MTSYSLPNPPKSDEDAELTALITQHDDYARQSVDTQLSISRELSIEQNRDLLDNLDRVRAEHIARAANAESTALTIRAFLRDAASWNEHTGTTVPMAPHTEQLELVTAPARA